MTTMVLKSRKDQFNFTRMELGIRFGSDCDFTFVDACPEGKRVCPISGVILDENNRTEAVLRLLGINESVWCWDRIPSRLLIHFARCEKCGIITCKHYVVHGGGLVCGNCFSRYYASCDSCGETHPIIEMHKFGDSFYCGKCRKRYIHTCERCGKQFVRYWECLDADDHVLTVCDECLESEYQRCSICNRYHPKGSSDISLYVDEYICGKCKDSKMSDINRGVLGYHCFDNMKYKIGRRKMPGENGNGLLYYGVELETEECYFDDVDVDSWINNGNLVHAENDGSLDDDSGVEWITLPCTLRYHREEFDWNGFCRELVSHGVRSHNTSTCGLHVHVNRDGLTPSVISKMDFLINRMKMLSIILARRSSFYCATYEEFKKLEWSIGYWDSIQNGLLEAIKRRGRFIPPIVGSRMSHDCRYRSVNTTNQYTIEVRIFRGTLNPETIIATLEYVDAIIAFVKQASPMLFKENIGNDMLCHEFISFLYKHQKEWPSLIPVLRRLSARHGWKFVSLGMSDEHIGEVLKHLNCKSEYTHLDDVIHIEDDNIEDRDVIEDDD